MAFTWSYGWFRFLRIGHFLRHLCLSDTVSAQTSQAQFSRAFGGFGGKRRGLGPRNDGHTFAKWSKANKCLCIRRQHGIIFQSIDGVMRYHGLKLLNKRGILLLHNFGIQISPFKLEKFLKNHRRQEKDMVKSVHEGHYLKTQIMALKAMTRGTFWVNVV